MKHYALVGQLISQYIMIVKDDTRYCRFTVAVLRKHSDYQTKIKFNSFDAMATSIAEKCLVGR